MLSFQSKSNSPVLTGEIWLFILMDELEIEMSFWSLSLIVPYLGLSSKSRAQIEFDISLKIAILY